MPPSSTARATTITVSVSCAFFTAGRRKALTPLPTASTPVIAVHPLANARSRIQSPTASVVTGRGGGAPRGRGRPRRGRGRRGGRRGPAGGDPPEDAQPEHDPHRPEKQVSRQGERQPRL